MLRRRKKQTWVPSVGYLGSSTQSCCSQKHLTISCCHYSIQYTHSELTVMLALHCLKYENILKGISDLNIFDTLVLIISFNRLSKSQRFKQVPAHFHFTWITLLSVTCQSLHSVDAGFHCLEVISMLLLCFWTISTHLALCCSYVPVKLRKGKNNTQLIWQLTLAKADTCAKFTALL